MKNTLLNVVKNFEQISNLENQEINDQVRDEFIEYMKPRPKTDQEKKFEKLLKEEKEKYERNKNKFYSNPIHWDNNKRRRHGLPVLRGGVNKYRSRIYPAFYSSAKFFGLLDDIVTETLENKFENSKFFESFVGVKDLAVGDVKVFEVSK